MLLSEYFLGDTRDRSTSYCDDHKNFLWKPAEYSTFLIRLGKAVIDVKYEHCADKEIDPLISF